MGVLKKAGWGFLRRLAGVLTNLLKNLLKKVLENPHPAFLRTPTRLLKNPHPAFLRTLLGSPFLNEMIGGNLLKKVLKCRIDLALENPPTGS